MNSGDDDDPGTRAEERRFAVVPGDPDDGRRWPEEPDPPAGESETTADVPTESPTDSSEVRRVFWTLVIVVDVAIIAVAVGLMLIGFERSWTLGGQLVVAGVILLVYGWYQYYRYRRSQDDSDEG